MRLFKRACSVESLSNKTPNKKEYLWQLHQFSFLTSKPFPTLIQGGCSTPRLPRCPMMMPRRL
ncbi:hypothetical protein [Moraxella lacunata]|uniref:hypothetical protein n=1 Tax=Moraxella lacunata TaxID=477 RepID=UPI003EDF9C2A